MDLRSLEVSAASVGGDDLGVGGITAVVGMSVGEEEIVVGTFVTFIIVVIVLAISTPR
jgi:hypothetical protein